MTKKDVFNFIRENPACTIATVDGDQPRVRGFLAVVFDGEEAIYFTTSTMKRVHEQLRRNPKVEMCYLTPDYSRMLRIAGIIEEVDDREKKQFLIDTRDYLKGFSADAPEFRLLRVKDGTARFWSLSDNLKEKDLPVVAI
jgi:uncharacterized pyridoxamine 5'-phosphate oxidase family protein